MNIKYKKIIMTLLLLTSINSFSYAEDFLANFQGTWGVGAGALDSNYISDDREVTVSPYIFGSLGNLQIEGNRLHYPLYTSFDFSILATANYRTQQYSKEFNKDRSIEAGLTLDIELISNLNTRFTVLGDISGKHDGYELETQLYRHDNLGNFSILSTIALQYQDESLANYYYSTNNYTAGDGYVFEAEVIASYPINNFSIFTGARSYWYENNVGNSPLASSSNTILGFTGVGYKF